MVSSQQPWMVYVLISADRRRTYVGITCDPDRRAAQHNGDLGGGAKSTRGGRPWSIGALYGPYTSRGEAQRAEYRVKQLRGKRRLEWRPVTEAQASTEGAG